MSRCCPDILSPATWLGEQGDGAYVYGSCVATYGAGALETRVLASRFGFGGRPVLMSPSRVLDTLAAEFALPRHAVEELLIKVLSQTPLVADEVSAWKYYY